MSTSKEAAVKLNLDAGNYVVAIKRVGDQTETAAQKAARAFKPLEAGLDRVKKDFVELGGKLKGVFGQVATLGGAVGFGAMVKGAAEAQEQYIALGNALSTFSEKMVSATEAQRAVERAADETHGSLEKLRGMGHQLAPIGDIELFEEALKRADMQARRLGVDGEVVAEAYARLFAKGESTRTTSSGSLSKRSRRRSNWSAARCPLCIEGVGQPAGRIAGCSMTVPRRCSGCATDWGSAASSARIVFDSAEHSAPPAVAFGEELFRRAA